MAEACVKSKIKEIRGLIYGMYDSETQFAKEMGWPRQKLNRITNGMREPDLNDISALASGLNRSIGEIANIFLNHKSPNG